MTPHEWIERYQRAWRERDSDAAAALFTDDGVYRSHSFREPNVGHDVIRAYWERAVATQREIDLRFGAPVVDGNRAAVEWWGTMMDAGEPVTLVGILMLRFSGDGRCEELREAWVAEPERRDPPPGWGV